MPPKRRQSLTKILLWILNDIGSSVVEYEKLLEALTTGYRSAYFQGGSSYVAELKYFRQRAAAKQKLRELARRRYIKIIRRGQQMSIVLNDKARSASLPQRLRATPRLKSGWYTVVIFDIPEHLRSERRQFRFLLRQGGFKRLQQSVWVTKQNVLTLIADFIRQAKIRQWVNAYRAKDFLKAP
ncbi:MAG: CRISPR-associated endonuclease Cas2 [Patescibacteria group bacterium]